MKPGLHHTLTIDRLTSVGAYLQSEDGTEVLLPNRYLTNEMKEGSEVRVFVYTDSEDRPVATTEEPLLELNQFGVLKVRDVTRFGAFLDWGLQKDLLLPHKEQLSKPRKGDWLPVYMYLDEKTGRLVVTEKLKKHFSREVSGLEKDQEVDLIVLRESELGTRVIVDGKYEGLIFKNSLFEDLLLGERTKGYITKVREDGKLDIVLQKQGYESIPGFAKTVLEELKENNGFLTLHDKSSPEEIQSRLQMSKKVFKKAIGYLYKEKVIKLEEGGIRLLKE